MGSKAGILCPCEKPVLASVLLPLAVAFAQRNKRLFYQVRAALILAARLCSFVTSLVRLSAAHSLH